MKIKRTIFGQKIDERCPKYTFMEKFLFLIGFIGDEKENEAFSNADITLRRKEGRL